MPILSMDDLFAKLAERPEVFFRSVVAGITAADMANRAARPIDGGREFVIPTLQKTVRYRVAKGWRLSTDESQPARRVYRIRIP